MRHFVVQVYHRKAQSSERRVKLKKTGASKYAKHSVTVAYIYLSFGNLFPIFRC